MKKLFFISGAVFVASGLFLMVYVFVFKETNPATAQPPRSQNDGRNIFGDDEDVPPAPPAIRLVVDEEVVGPFVDRQNERIVLYSKQTGHAFVILPDTGGRERLSNEEISGIADVHWSPDANFAILTLVYDGAKRFAIHIPASGDRIEVPTDVEDIAWSLNDNQLLYKTFDVENEERLLWIAQSDLSDAKKLSVVPFRYENIRHIPRTALIALWSAPDANSQTQLSTVPLTGGDPVNLFSDRYGADFSFSPNGQRILVSSSIEQGGTQMVLGTINRDGADYTNLDFPTMVDKCAWSIDSKTIYCALPGGTHDAQLPNAWDNGEYRTKDTFWSIDVQTGKKQRIVEIEEITQRYDADDVFLSPTEDAFFFVNRYDGKLYAIDL
jgi:hypothetical protein